MSTLRLAEQASLDPRAAAEALAEAYTQLLDWDVFIDHDGGDRVLSHKGVTLAIVAADGTIAVLASAADLASLAGAA